MECLDLELANGFVGVMMKHCRADRRRPDGRRFDAMQMGFGRCLGLKHAGGYVVFHTCASFW